MKSGHQKHTIRNFILGELRRYVRCSIQEFNFSKMKNKFFKRLCLRGYKKTLFEKTLQESETFFENLASKISTKVCY